MLNIVSYVDKTVGCLPSLEICMEPSVITKPNLNKGIIPESSNLGVSHVFLRSQFWERLQGNSYKCLGSFLDRPIQNLKRSLLISGTGVLVR